MAMTFSDLMQQEICDAFIQGHSINEIADHFGIGKTSVRRVLANHELIEPLTFHKTPEEILMLECLRANGITTVIKLRERLQ